MKWILNENTSLEKVSSKLEALKAKQVSTCLVEEIAEQCFRFIEMLNDSSGKGMTASFSKSYSLEQSGKLVLLAETSNQQSLLKRIMSL